MRIEERDETGRLIYASKSNYGDVMDDAFPGPKRGVPRADVTGTTPGLGTNSIERQYRLPKDYAVPAGRSR
jgi:hypothetical protein